MTSKIKNIIIFVVIGVALILVYIFFFKPAPPTANLTSSNGAPVVQNTATTTQTNQVGGDFLSLLLSVKSIKLDDSIFSDPAFATLRDSSIELVPDGTEGRPNPFAPIGSDVLSASVSATGSLAPTGSEAFTTGIIITAQ